MSYHDILDLRTLAQEWRSEISNTQVPTELDEATRPYRDLCVELGIDRTPDDLDSEANHTDPALIHEDYFPRYVQDFAEDIGAVSRDMSDWIVIDWDKTADNLKADYVTVEFDGNTYYRRQ